MTYREHFRKTWTLAWPVMIGQFGHVLVGLADSIMLGQLGTIPLAAAAFANSIFVVPLVFGIGMSMGITPPIANADGQGKREKVGSFLRHGLAINAITSVFILIAVLIFSRFTHLMGQEKTVETLATPYLIILVFSNFPLMYFLTLKQFAEGLSDTRFAMLASLGANLLNIFFNYLLIYGHWGFPMLGLNGAGYATLAARFLMAFAMYLYIFRHPKFHIYLKQFLIKKWQKSTFKKILDIGLPSGVQYIFEVSAFAVAAIFVGQISAEALAAHQIAISLVSLSYMMATGLGAAATVRVGNQLGARNFQTMREAGRTCLFITLIFMGKCGVVFFLGKDWFPTFYTNDIDVMKTASQLFFVAVFFQLFDGAQVVALGALRGISDTRLPTLLTFVSYWIFGLLPAYLMGIVWEMGPLGVWYGLALGLIFAAVLLYGRFEYRCKKIING